jgi:hypothetical protein
MRKIIEEKRSKDPKINQGQGKGDQPNKNKEKGEHSQ